MTFHLAAFTESLAASQTNVEVAPLTDDVLGISDNGFLLQEPWQIVWAAGFQTAGTGSRIATPSYRQIALPAIMPINIAAVPASRPGISDYRDSPLGLPALANLKIEASTTTGGGRGTYFTALQRQLSVAPAGDVYTLRSTSATAATANVWSTLTITPDFNVPAGFYELVGMVYMAANSIGARAIIENQIERPGCVSQVAIGGVTHEMFRKGRLGSWGRFNSTRLPTIQVLCNAATAVHEVFMDIVKVA